jgi:hypothetical protein
MNTNRSDAVNAAIAGNGKQFRHGQGISLSQRERAGVRESASNDWHIRRTRKRIVMRTVLPHPLSLSRWERETAGEHCLQSLLF